MRARSSGLSSFHASAKGGSYSVRIRREDPVGLNGIFLISLGMSKVRNVPLAILSAIGLKAPGNPLELLGATRGSSRVVAFERRFGQLSD
jgi:hypothetical protein